MKLGNYFEINAPKIYLLAQHPPKNDKTSFTFFFEQGYCVTCGLFDFGIHFFFFFFLVQVASRCVGGHSYSFLVKKGKSRPFSISLFFV